MFSKEYIPVAPSDLIWMSLRDHVRHNLPPFSHSDWWGPIVAMATCKPLISLHISEVSIISCEIM